MTQRNKFINAYLSHYNFLERFSGTQDTQKQQYSEADVILKWAVVWAVTTLKVTPPSLKNGRTPVVIKKRNFLSFFLSDPKGNQKASAAPGLIIVHI